MLMSVMGVLPPLVFGVVWLAVMLYLLFLATRFVTAVERIADRMGTQPRS